MNQEIGKITTVPLRQVWEHEDADFTPWLTENIGELDAVLGIGLTNARKEEPAKSFRIDIVAATDQGDIVIENQFGTSDHKHLGQLVTYLSDRDVDQGIWIVEKPRPEHVKAVEMLNDRGIRIWMVTVRALRIGESARAADFRIVAGPAPQEDSRNQATRGELKPAQIKRRQFLEALYTQANEEGIESPFKRLSPSIDGYQSTPANGQELLYRIAVSKTEARVVLMSKAGHWAKAFNFLETDRERIGQEFKDAGLGRELDWEDGRATNGRWSIRYAVDLNYSDAPDLEKLRELNQASAAMKSVLGPRVKRLDPQLKDEPPDADAH